MNIKNLFGLDFMGGKSESVAARPHKFTPVGYPIAATEREGPFPEGIPWGEVVQRRNHELRS